MPPSRSRRKQSRLTFSPLSSSSPAVKACHEQIQDRAAAVRYEMSPAKKRKVHHGANNEEDELANAMPTPTPTASRTKKTENSDSDSEPVRSTQRRVSVRDATTSKRRSRQSTLRFGGHTETSAKSAFAGDSSPVISSSSHGMFARARQRSSSRLFDQDSDAEEGDDLPSPSKLLKHTRAREKIANEREVQSNASRSRQNWTRSSQRAIIIESGDEAEEVHREEARQLSPPQLDGSVSSNDEMPTTQGKQTRTKQRARRRVYDDFINDGAVSEGDDSEHIELIARPKRNGEQHNQEFDDDEDDEDDSPITPARRKLKRPRQLTQQEQDDLNEDLDFLGPSSDVEDQGRQPRNTQSTQKDARKQALETLKRKRSGTAQQQPLDVERDAEGSWDEGDVQSDDEDDELEEEAPPATSREMFEEDEYDENFLTDEDGTNELGIPSDIPLQFTRYASMKARELFKYAIEWMVQKKINPAFAMNDEIYELTFKKLDDEVRGLAGSKFMSAAWTPEFTKALQGRPEATFNSLDRIYDHLHDLPEKCDACNRNDRHATWEVTFSGKPYQRDSLDPVERHNDNDGSESSSEDEDDPAYDAHGRQLPPQTKKYLVGRYCKANAETAHALYHWRLHLYDWVDAWLTSRGYANTAEIVKRDKMTESKRRKQANKIVDRMDDENVVKELWTVFKQKIEDARASKQGRFEVASP